MKKSLLILLSLVPLAILSCKKEPKEVAPDPAEMNVATTTFSASKGEGTVTVPVEANYSTIKVSVADDAKDWLYFVSASATKAEMTSYSVVLGVRENPTVKERTGNATITLSAAQGTVSKDIAVTQEAGDPVISLDMESVKVNPRGMTLTIPVVSNDNVKLSSDASWITAGTGTGDGIVIVAAANTTGEARSADVVFYTETDANVKVSLAVNQKAYNADPNAINVLAIGNNASTAAMTNLYAVLDSLGYTSIRLGNLYQGDTKLADQAALIASEEEAYKYAYTNAEGGWVVTDTTAVNVLEPEDWDFIVLQEATSLAAVDYAALGSVVSAVRVTNPFTPIAWSMGWAPCGAADQMDKYETVSDIVKNTVAENKEISLVIPVGTAVQNLRTSFFEDNIGSGENLSANIGIPAATLTWAVALTGKEITGENLEKVFPAESKYEYETPYKPAVLEAVNSAIAKPYAVTAATEYAPVKTAADETAARAAITAAGFNADDYVQVPITLVFRAFWSSTSSTALSVAWAGTTGATKNSFVSSVKLEKSAIPVGSLIYVASGFQYRPEGWQSLGANNSKTRPGNTSDTIVEVTPAWWDTDGYNYRAFNVSKNPSDVFEYSEMAVVAKSFGIFVPKTALTGGLEDYGNGEWNW